MICSAQDLDCVNQIVVDTEDCLEQCEGTIVDYSKISSIPNEEGWTNVLHQYEEHKHYEDIKLHKFYSYSILKGKSKRFSNAYCSDLTIWKPILCLFRSKICQQPEVCEDIFL